MTDAGDPDRRQADSLPAARRRRTRWPGWVWVIPLAALIFAGWLGVKEWVIGPGQVTVRFVHAEGLSSGAAVRYRGAKVGRVVAVHLAGDRQHVDVALSIDQPLASHLGARTRFWIERPELAKGQIRGLMSGPRIVVDPVEGARKRVFDGLAAPPILPAEEPGRRFVLRSDDAGSLSPGAPVLFRGVTVGRVLGSRLTDSDKQADVYVFVRKRFADLVRQNSVFWRAGGMSLSTANGVNVNLPSLQAVISGEIAFATPAVFAGSRAGRDAVFRLYGSRASAKAVAGGAAFAYFIRFPEPVGGLARGAVVTFGGRQIGRVAHVGLPAAGKGGSFTTPVDITLDARALHLSTQGAKTRKDLRQRLDQDLANLIANGLRAKVSPGGLLSGKSVELVFVSGAQSAPLDRHHQPPAIPAAPAKSG